MSTGKRERYFKFLLYVIVIVLINVAGLTLFFRWDLTGGNMYSLSPVSKQTVASLSEPLTIKAFFSRDLPPPYNTLERYVRDLLEEYRIQAGQNFNYSLINPGPENEKGVQLAESYGLRPMQVEVIKQDELQYKKAYMGIVLIHGDVVETIPEVTSARNVEYLLTSSIESMENKVSALLNLDGKIKVRLYLSSSLGQIAPKIGLDRLKELPDRVREIVEALNRQNYGQLDFKLIDPSLDQGSQPLPENHQLQTLEWPDMEEEDIEGGEGSIGLILKHGDQVKSVSLLNVVRLPLIGTQYSLLPREKIKASIDNSLKSLLDINQNIGYVTGHGIPPLRQYRGGQPGRFSVAAFRQLVEKNYTLQEVDLAQGLPEGLSSLIIAGPSQPFSRFELYQLDQALMQGTNLGVFLDGVVQKTTAQQARQQPPALTPNRTGLEKLLQTYGMQVEESLLLDENCYQQRLNQQMGGGERAIYFAPIIKNQNINHEPAFMDNIKGLVALKNSPLRHDESVLRDNDLDLQTLFSSSKRSWTMSRNISLNPMLLSPPNSGENMSSRPLAYLVSGTFPSHFAGQPIPAQEAEEERPQEAGTKDSKGSAGLSGQVGSRGIRLDKSKRVKIGLIGSSDMLSDSVVDKEGSSMNSIFLLNLLDELNNRTGMAKLRSKVQQFNPIGETTNMTRIWVKAVNIGGLPFLVLVFGLLVWGARSRRKKRIRAMFAE
ncbi:MAG: Gldg family protein [Desulfohalobiaceae bacterium]|nr:Gldg family protein [Desulfohalobiaceae bacterium]